MYIEIRPCGIRLNLLVPVGLFFLLLLNGAVASAVMLFAAVLHEAAHILCANAVGAPIVRFDIEPWGGKLLYGGMTSYRQELAISSAGIVANLLTAPIGLISPFGVYGRLFFYSSLCYALVNLIPMKGLDGGETMRCLIAMQSKTSDVENAERTVNMLSLIFILVLGAMLCIASGFNLSVVFLCLYSVVITVCDLAKRI